MKRRIVAVIVLLMGACGIAVATASSPASGATAQVWAVGDMARCANGAGANRAAADVVASSPRQLLALGDEAYPDGSATDFSTCYDPVWGQFRASTRPVPGNHEYRTAGAAGYFGYFGALGSWYSWELNGWQLLALNSNCSSVGGCGPGSTQYTWLESQLRDSPRLCQVAYWHHPRWTQGEHGNTAEVGPLYNLLVQYGVELLLSGHDHLYERYAPTDAAGAASPDGVVQIVAGTGGAELYSASTTNAPTPLVRNDTTVGALSLDLDDGAWRTQFVPAAGQTFTDSASGSCHTGPLTPGGTTTTTGGGGSTTTTTTIAPPGTTTTTAPPGPDTQEPNSTVTAPLAAAAITSPAAFAGTATDDVGVARVRVAARDDATQLWLQSNGSFTSTFTQFDATLSAPGTRSTGWSLTSALPTGVYHLSVRAVDTGGRIETSTPWVPFQVNASGPPPPTTTTTTTTTTIAPPGSTTTTTTPGSTDFNDQWAFWGYLFSDGKRQSNGTYRWDQSPYRFTESTNRFLRGAALNGIGVRQDTSGAWLTTVPVATIPDPRSVGNNSALAPFLAATIEDEGTCRGLVFDNFDLPMVQYARDLFTAAGVTTSIRTGSGGFNDLLAAEASWPVLNTWPYATTARTPGAPGCTVETK